FLTQLFDNDPDSMVKVICQQFEKLKPPPHTVDELLENLEKNNKVLEFVRRVRRVRFDESYSSVVRTAK
ncbi:MAG: hypothetical protein AB1861_14050, partial [Cyanobacteriota bacterium]